MRQENFMELMDEIRQFAKDRDWEHFHSPKNLSMALSLEASELLEIFQWMKEEDSKKIEDEVTKGRIREEVADVAVYLLRIVDALDIDLYDAIKEKMKINAQKYPADKVKGSSKKYDEY